jgi:hypothetical protein
MRFNILTCWRQNLGDTYLLRTVAQLARQLSALMCTTPYDAHSVFVYVDGTAEEYDRIKVDLETVTRTERHVPVIVRLLDNQRIGNTRAWQAMLQQACALGTNASAVFMEDDLQIAQGAVSTMCDLYGPPHCAFLTFYDSDRLPEGSPDGVFTQSVEGEKGYGFWGTLAVKMPYEVALYLANEDWSSGDVKNFAGYKLHLENWGNGRNAADVVMSALLARSPWPDIAIHVPSLVQHVGTSSATFGPGVGLRDRTARNWRP